MAKHQQRGRIWKLTDRFNFISKKQSNKGHLGPPTGPTLKQDGQVHRPLLTQDRLAILDHLANSLHRLPEDWI